MKMHPNFTDYKKQLTGKKCLICGKGLKPSYLKGYPHDGGYTVFLFGKTKEKLWLYAECKNCGYQNALWKLGIKDLSGDKND